MFWTVTLKEGPLPTCGYNNCQIGYDQPVQVLTFSASSSARRFYRCVEHAHGPVDEAQVAAARIVRDTKPPVSMPLRTHSRSARDGFMPLKAVIPFDELPADIQRAQTRAAGDGSDR